MSAEATEKVIERIRKLMRYATDGSASEAEYENAMGHARKLMDRYSLTEDAVLLEETQKQNAYDSIIEEDAFSRAGSLESGDLRLARVPCLICDVKSYVSRRYADKKGKPFVNRNTGRTVRREFVVFFGLPKDVAVAKALYVELLATVRAMGRLRLGSDFSLKTFADYREGFVDRLIHRAKQAKDTSSATPQKSGEASLGAIILAKDAMLGRYDKEKLGLVPLRKKYHTPSNTGHYSAGFNDGGKVDLGTRGISSSSSGRSLQ